MKKMRMIIIVGVVALLVVGGGVAYGVAVNHERQLEVNPATGAVMILENYRGFITEQAKPAQAGALEVPIYSESMLVEQKEWTIFLGRDSGYLRDANVRPDGFAKIETKFPSEAIRESADGSYIYVMYDTDAGARLYLFFSREKEYHFVDGFPVLMNARLSYQDLAGLKVGDSMDIVEGIDPVIAVYRRLFDTGNDIVLENYTKRGAPPTSIHLLSDGILKIEYARNANDGYTITNLTYSPDFVLDGLDGKTCYRIAEVDYVK